MPYLNCGDSAIIPFESGDSVDSREFSFFGEFWASVDLIIFVNLVILANLVNLLILVNLVILMNLANMVILVNLVIMVNVMF